MGATVASATDTVAAFVDKVGSRDVIGIKALIESARREPDGDSITPDEVATALSGCKLYRMDQEKYKPATMIAWACSYVNVDGKVTPEGGYLTFVTKSGSRLNVVRFSRLVLEGYRGPVIVHDEGLAAIASLVRAVQMQDPVRFSSLVDANADATYFGTKSKLSISTLKDFAKDCAQSKMFKRSGTRYDTQWTCKGGSYPPLVGASFAFNGRLINAVEVFAIESAPIAVSQTPLNLPPLEVAK